MDLAEAVRLNLGCRNRKIEGFIGIDCDNHEGVDIVADVSDLSQFKDGSVQEIMASHIIEHVHHVRTMGVLKEWARVLEPGGKLYVAVPDFARCVELYPEMGLNQWMVNFLMGDQGYATAFHYNLFDEDRLIGMLKEAGFSDAFRVVEFPIGDDNDCSRMVSNWDNQSVSLNVIGVK